MAVAGKVEEDGLGGPFFFRLQGFVDGDANGVGRFRRGNNAFRARELDASLEATGLMDGAGSISPM